ncbi:MAG: SDR family oxidoreductase [Chthoniobacterales bacterium]
MSQNYLFDLTGETALVIGATGILGGAMAEALATAGARVAVGGRNQERGFERVEAITTAGGEAMFVEVDASSRKSLTEAADSVEKAFGPVSVLVNAAGGNAPDVIVTPENPFEAITLEALQGNVDLNFTGGAFLPCQVFGPRMCARKHGSIINIASVAAHHPLSKVVVYAAAKAAVINLTQFLGREWAPQGVRVNSITPGFFPAEQNRRLLYNEDGSPTPRAQSILNHTGLGRFGEAKELAGAVVFLASKAASSFVTGTDIRVDGGYLSQTI